jgi:hypothetical protein
MWISLRGVTSRNVTCDTSFLWTFPRFSYGFALPVTWSRAAVGNLRSMCDSLCPLRPGRKGPAAHYERLPRTSKRVATRVLSTSNPATGPFARLVFVRQPAQPPVGGVVLAPASGSARHHTSVHTLAP